MTNERTGGQYSISGIRSHESVRSSLGRRQAFASTLGQPNPHSTPVQAATSSTVVYPSAPTSTPSSESSVQDLSFSLIDQPSIISWNDA